MLRCCYEPTNYDLSSSNLYKHANINLLYDQATYLNNLKRHTTRLQLIEAVLNGYK